MKKLLLILLFSLSTFMSAETFHLKTSEFNFRLNGHEWIGWEASDLNILWDFDMRRLVIYTADKQVIDYEKLSIKRGDGFTIYTAYATDYNHVLIRIELYIYDTNGSYLKLKYFDREYVYRIYRPNENEMA